MLWIFLFIVFSLILMYVFGKTHSESSMNVKYSDSIIVSAILSTLVAHGILSIAQEEVYKDSNLKDLEAFLINTHLINKGEWDTLVTDHLQGNSLIMDSKDFDLG
ncbi:hypothetical protein [Rossellomorea aquimaris]|uniref:hypothetical protein n=1 Tax=Rossellomorea aquimaris TaxID=189382 RepID=UPI0007D0A517|nr:hypothetical protein [Rossellomorea aquimaris]